MKTWIVRSRFDDRQCWVGNAESAEEAVAYAIAKGGLILDQYVVYDHDLNRVVIPYPTPTAN